MKNNELKNNIVDDYQVWYGIMVHWISITVCIIALIAPVLILLFPSKNILNPNLVFRAMFDGKKAVDIWAAAGTPFKTGDFWPLFIKNFFTPDGFGLLGITIGCSVTLWSLIPAIYLLAKRKDWFYTGVSLFVFVLIALAMSGLVQMAG
ncbi:MAG: hypothetical protein FWD78_08020 [Treponema sp.]|nr:hypothetical protein [Treponema sp.]